MEAQTALPQVPLGGANAGRCSHFTRLWPPHWVFLLFTPVKSKNATWSQITVPSWPSKWIPGAYKHPPTGRHLSFTPQTIIQQNQTSHCKEWNRCFNPFGFLKNEGEDLIIWGLLTLLCNANGLLGLWQPCLSFLWLGCSHLDWKAKSGILTMNFLVFNRLKSKGHILIRSCMKNFHWSYSCISEFS